MPAVKEARLLHVGGIVQGVGFRPFVYRIALAHGITGWVLNAESGVVIHAEGDAQSLDRFASVIANDPPPAARVTSFEITRVVPCAFDRFDIRTSEHRASPSVAVCADLPVCADCLRELFDPADRRYRYPYINCTNCGPRYSIMRGLPYDRAQTTMGDWPMCDECRAEYDDPTDRRFHAQPVACHRCGPTYMVYESSVALRGEAAIAHAARLLCDGNIVAMKGIGGYHLACDARNRTALRALRERKYRKERPFALMTRDVATARSIVDLNDDALALLTDAARPIVLARATVDLPYVAPGNSDLGVMLAYTPLQHLLFDAGAPGVLVMTSANRSSEPIAYRDDDAEMSLAGIADAFLVGEREIARRVDDSVVTATSAGRVVVRHARGYAPQAIVRLPTREPVVALGADLKNAVALVVDGAVFVSQHIGDLEHFEAFQAFKSTIADLQALYEMHAEEMLVVHDAHPQYVSSSYAQELPGVKIAVQHHRAHIASVLAEYGAFEESVLGFAFDGTGYGDDGTIWGGEIFDGSLGSGFERVAHLRPAVLAGGDAAARFPAQAAAGFLVQIDTPNLEAPPFEFPPRYRLSRELVRAGIRVFPTTSMGRLFDTAAALLGFTREITFEAQAAMWLEHLARASAPVPAYPFPFADGELDFRPLLAAILHDRLGGRDLREIARAFHGGIVNGILAVSNAMPSEHVVVSGGVFQNVVLLDALQSVLGPRLWTNHATPPNDGGICLGQAAIACCTIMG